ncbi:RIP metalloprotease RseP [Candidatus Latescibacterota bacterium]
MITIVAFLFVLSLLVLVHELGHYTIAKLGGIGVERFSIGLPPRLFGVKIGETDYCISSIPFGGYVKLTGQEDIGEEDEAGSDYDPKDYRGKSTPLKIAVLMAGSMMNIFTAVLIFFFLFYFKGVPENTTIIGNVENGTLAYEMGINAGDEVLEIQGNAIERFDEILLPFYMDENASITVKALGETKTLTAPRKLEENEDFGLSPFFEAKLGIIEGGPADEAGFMDGDVVTAIDENSVSGWFQMSKIIRANPDIEMTFTLLRDGASIRLPVMVGHINEDQPDGTRNTVGRIGASLQYANREVSLVESAEMAVKNTVYLSKLMLDFFGKLVTGRMSAKLLGGPIMIAQMAGETAKTGFSSLLSFTAFISINLGVLNLMPFPVLDGGHIFILLIETVIRRKVSEKMKLRLQQAGSLVLLSLMLYITFNDFMRFDAISKIFGG